MRPSADHALRSAIEKAQRVEDELDRARCLAEKTGQDDLRSALHEHLSALRQHRRRWKTDYERFFGSDDSLPGGGDDKRSSPAFSGVRDAQSTLDL